MKLRVGVVGIGRNWDARHAPALRSLSDRFEVRAVCDQVAHRAEATARQFGAVSTDGFQTLAQRHDIDAVMLLARQWYGVLPILAACERGKSVYCSSDLDLNPLDAQQVEARVRESGVAFMAEFPRRYSPATLRLKELIATRLGEPRLLVCDVRGLMQPDRGPVWGGPTSFMHELSELIDWCCYLVGQPPMEISANLHCCASKSDFDFQSVCLEFGKLGQGPARTMAHISAGRYIPKELAEAASFRPPAALQVTCAKGIAFVDLPNTVVWFDPAGSHFESLDQERPIGERLFSQFYRSVTSLVRNTTGMDDTFRALALASLAARSHTEGRRIRVE